MKIFESILERIRNVRKDSDTGSAKVGGVGWGGVKLMCVFEPYFQNQKMVSGVWGR